MSDLKPCPNCGAKVLRNTPKCSETTTKLKPSSEFHCTPEQAIAATLGGGECEMEKLERWDGSQPSFRCKECGHENYEDDIPNYCPRCGKAVKR